MKYVSTAALIASLLAGQSFAAEVTGGDIQLRYSTFTGDDLDYDATSISGSVEVGFTKQFSVQGDIGFRFFDNDIDSNYLTLHGIGHVSDATSVGLFVGREEFEGFGETVYGAEVGHEFGSLSGEAYVALSEIEGADVTLLGISADYAVTEAFKLGVAYHNVDLEGFDASRIALRGEYGMGGFSVTGEIGSGELDQSLGGGSETFIGIGLKTTFGASRGSTFERRSLFELFPG
ncbi:hypothetical protein LV82_02565 [Albidovulum inexpectatum]|uniref:Porin n=1 Tax=Albidovulum inexpectatum TaxID=196587 RepID=A0A2S5JE38_9RHOB|nr:hypothetical protein [Albidovulum inexpectatum]PPB79774.1 hypothetical protein LV82_02565 [Albidovulum inexpectatum]